MSTENSKKRTSYAEWAAGVILIAMGGWLAHLYYLADHGYQSKQLTETAQPVVDAMNAAKAESLTCSYRDAVHLKLDGRDIKLPVQNKDDYCPVVTRLSIDKDRTVRLSPLAGIQEIDIQLVEQDFKSKSVSERRAQFAHLADQVKAKAAELAKQKAEAEALELKRIEAARAARATWDASH